LRQRLEAWLRVRAVVTVMMTIALIAMLFHPAPVQEDVMTLFCASYGAIITFFFAKGVDSGAEQ